MKITFESSDTPFKNGKYDITYSNYKSQHIPRIGEEVRLIDVDPMGPIRLVFSVIHYYTEDVHEISVFLCEED